MLGYYKPYYILSCFRCFYDIFLFTRCRLGKTIPDLQFKTGQITNFFHLFFWSIRSDVSKPYFSLILLKIKLNNWANCTLLIAETVYINCIRILSMAANGSKFLFIQTVRVAGEFSHNVYSFLIGVNHFIHYYLQLIKARIAKKKPFILTVRVGGESSHQVYSCQKALKEYIKRFQLTVRVGGEFSNHVYRLLNAVKVYKIQIIQCKNLINLNPDHSNNFIYLLNVCCIRFSIL